MKIKKSFPYERLTTEPCLNTEAPGNSKMAYLTLRGCVAKFGGHSLYGRKLFNFKAESPGLNRQKYYSLKKCIAFFFTT